MGSSVLVVSGGLGFALAVVLSWRLYSRAKRMHTRFEAAVSPRRIVASPRDAGRRGSR